MISRFVSLSRNHILHYARGVVAATRSVATMGSVGEAPSASRVIKGVVFDMDGTLTVPVIDFAEMRRRVGITSGDILHVIDSWSPTDRQKALDAIAEIEAEALQRMKIMPDALELCTLLDNARIPRALVTRNVSSSVDFFHATHFNLPPFFPSLSREWTPYKPDPAALHHIADHWGVDPTEMVMIGDSAKDDIVCGNRAGATTILLDVESVYSGIDDEKLQGELKPDFYVESLAEVAKLLQEQVQLVSPESYGTATASGEAL